MKSDELESEKFTSYTGNRLLNFNVLLFLGCLVVTIVTFDSDYIFAYCVFNGSYFGYVAFNANYFLLSENSLRVKNFLWYWKEKTYPLNDIKEINIILTRRSSTCAKIIQQDNTSKEYKSCSLGEKDWVNLHNDLASRGIKVQSIYL